MKMWSVFFVLSFLSTYTFADGVNVGLGGYSPVSYIDSQKAIYGTPKFKSENKGKAYYFENAAAKAKFEKDSDKYTAGIQYDGWCATGLAMMGKNIASDPTIFSVDSGKVYFFSSPEAKKMFDKDVKKIATDADAAWAKIKQ